MDVFKATLVTTEHWRGGKAYNDFFLPKGKKALAKGQSPRQELEVE